jgi:hypothetical protein
MTELTEKLSRNARFYAAESVALGEDVARRDRRNLGAKEAATISQLLREAADALQHEGAGP